MALMDFATSFEDIFPSGPASFAPTTPPDTSFNWSGVLPAIQQVGNAFAPIAQIGALGWNAYNQLAAQRQNAAYDQAMKDYWTQKAAWEGQYNQAMMDYLARKSEYEAQLMGMAGESMSAFQEGLGNYQQTIAGILAEQMGAVKPLLAQSRELLEPAVAALAKGEVPPQWEPVLAQVKQRVTNAMLQNYANAGIDMGTAAASIQQDVDQQAMAMLLQMGQQALAGGTTVAQTGLAGAAQAGATAGLGIDPLVKEQQLMWQALSSLFSGFPQLAGSSAPPRPTA